MVRPARFELATYGFVVRAPVFPNLLKLGQDSEIIALGIFRFWTLVQVFADFGQIFTHRFTHEKALG
jgi:hypothetical protein